MATKSCGRASERTSVRAEGLSAYAGKTTSIVAAAAAAATTAAVAVASEAREKNEKYDGKKASVPACAAPRTIHFVSLRCARALLFTMFTAARMLASMRQL